jgi:DNA-binding beta-propeller fold protein YncE
MNSHTALMRMLVILGIVGLLLVSGCGGSTSQSLNNQPPPPSGSNPIPTITTMSPKSAAGGGAAFTLTINGVNFVAGSMVNFGGTARTTTFVSATQLTAAIPAAAIALDGYAEVTVTNPAPGGGPADRVWFAVIGGTNPVPTINSLDSTGAFVGGQAFTLTVYGLNFVASSVVRWNGIDRPTTVVISWCCGPLLTAQIPASDLAAAGTAAVTVFNPALGGGTSKAMNFTITGGANAGPTIDSLSPSCAPQGTEVLTPYFNRQLLVHGQNFVAGSVVRWNGSDRPTTFFGDSELFALISTSDTAVAGTADLTVFNPSPGGGSSNASTFNIFPGLVGPSSITVDRTGKLVFVLNHGCPFGYVSMYAINPTTGSLTSIAPPVPTREEGGRNVAVDPFGKFAYVANFGGRGDSEITGDVSMYAIKATTGALTSIGAIPQNCPGLCAPSSVAVDPSGKFAYVTSGRGMPPTSVSMFTINTATGALTPNGTIAAGGHATFVAVDPTGNFAYVTAESGPTGSTGNIFMYKINATSGILQSIGTIPAGIEPTSIAVDPMGNFAYVSNFRSEDVSMYTINTTTGALTPIGTTTGGGGSIAIHPSGKFVYVSNSAGSFSVYTIDITKGALTLTGTTGVADSFSSIAIHPSGAFAYVPNFSSNSVSIYRIDAATGAFTLIGTT